MILGLKDQFVSFVEDGSKTHTIRAGNRWKVGMRADLFAESRRRKVYASVRVDGDSDCVCLGDGMIGFPCHAKRHSRYEQRQTSGMRLLFRAMVTKVEEIEIRTALPLGPWIVIDGQPLNEDEADLFAWRDGFRHRTLPSPTAMSSVVSPVTMGCFEMMMAFWQSTHNLAENPFVGQVIHWSYTERFMDVLETCFRESARRAALVVNYARFA